ncbi:MAG: SCP2 sterol-binding domain-containing protein [Pseudonocardiaceae bacterium]
MVANATRASWQQGQDALRDVVQQATTVLRSVQDPAAPAVGHWTVGEVAMHLSQAWLLVPSLARGDLSEFHAVIPSSATVPGGSVIRDMWDLEKLTNQGVQADQERCPRVIADRIEARAEKYLDECTGADPDAEGPWIVQGTSARRDTLTYHLLNETLVHSYDIARAAKRPFRMEPSHAAMALGRFVVRVLQANDPRTFVNGKKAARVRATYDLRIRGGASFHFIFDNGELTIVDPAARPVDCHISADPVALLLVVFGRQSQWPAIAKGKLMAWGRKPWLGPQLNSLVRNP